MPALWIRMSILALGGWEVVQVAARARTEEREEVSSSKTRMRLELM